MLSSLELKQVVGKYFTGSQFCFHSSAMELFAPLNNGVLHLDLERNSSAILPINARSKTEIVALCRQNELLVVSDSQNRVYLYSLPGRQLLGSKNMKAPVSHVAFAHNNRFFCVAAGKHVFVYQKPPSNSSVLLEPLPLIRKVPTKAVDALTCLALTADDRFLIYAGDDNAVRIAPLFRSKNQHKDWELFGHKNTVRHVRETLGTDGFLFSFDVNGLLLLWKLVPDLKEGVNGNSNGHGGLKRVKTDGPGTDGDAAPEETAFDPLDALSPFELQMEGSRFILQAKHMVFQEGVGIRDYCFHDNLLLIGFSNSTFSIYSLHPAEPEPFKPLLTFRLSDSHARFVTFHPRLSVVGIANSLSGLAVWDYKSKTFLISQGSGTNEVSAFVFNDKGALLAVGDFQGAVRLFDAATYFGVATFLDATARISQIRFMKDNTMLVSSLDGVVRAYDLTRNKLFREMRPHVSNQILALEVERNGDLVVGAGSDPYDVYVWSLKTGHLLEVLSNHTAPVHLLQFSNQKQTLLSASWDRSVRAINLMSKDKVEEKIEMGDRIVDLKLAKSEKVFAVATARNEVHFFLLDEMQLFSLVDLKAEFPLAVISGIEFSFDGKTALVVGGANGVVSVDVGHKVATGKLRLTANRDYRFNGEKVSSKTVRDGIETKTDYLTYATGKSGVVLPGSVGAHAKEAAKPVFGATAVASSPDGQTLVVACSEGLLAFGRRAEKSHWRLSSDVTKDSLKALLEQGKFVEFFVTCLHLRLYYLVELVAWRLDEAHVHSVVRSLSWDLLLNLTEFLKPRLAALDRIEPLFLWTKALFMYRLADLETPELRPFVTLLSSFFGQRLDDLVGGLEFNEEAIAFLAEQARGTL